MISVMAVHFETDGRKITKVTCDTPAEAAELMERLNSAPARPKRTELTARYFEAADKLDAGYFKTIDEAAASVDCSLNVMRRVIWAAKLITPDHRRLGLNTELHLVIAGLKRPCPTHLDKGFSSGCPACEVARVAYIDLMLEQAERSHWTKKQLEDEIRKDAANIPSGMGRPRKAVMIEAKRNLSLVGPKTAM
jgi:hypothetical protein